MVLNVFKIPLLNVPQDFTITLSNRELRMVSKWNDEGQVWVLDIYDGITEDSIISNIPMIAGVDLLEQYEYLGLNGGLAIYTNGDGNAIPTLENLGTESNLFFANKSDQ